MKTTFLLLSALSAIPGIAVSADAERGAALFKKQCSACHVASEPKNKVGPHLPGIVGRKVASVEGFRYSKAMQEFAADGKAWEAEKLQQFLRKPRDLVKGTSMGFAGVKDDSSVGDIVEYLKTLPPHQ